MRDIRVHVVNLKYNGFISFTVLTVVFELVPKVIPNDNDFFATYPTRFYRHPFSQRIKHDITMSTPRY